MLFAGFWTGIVGAAYDMLQQPDAARNEVPR
jgi:hypothetical protein